MAKSWKSVERAIAKSIGGVRVPITGRARGSAPDITHPDLSSEVKSRASIPGWLEEAVQQAEASARDGQLPVAIIHEDFRGFDTSLVVVRLAAFKDRFMVDGRLR